MQSTNSTTPVACCAHPRYRIGCYACGAADAHRALLEAQGEKQKFEAEKNGIEPILQTDQLDEPVRKRLVAELTRVTQQLARWSEREEGLCEVVDYFEQEVNTIRNANDTSELANALEDSADDRETDFRYIWRNKATSSLVQMDLEDLDRAGSYKGLDRSNIPATLDSMLGKGAALQAFVNFSKPQGLQGLDKAVGSKTGPAMMAYGSATKMFGLPKDPYDMPQPKTEPATESSLAGNMENYTLTKSASTKRKFRIQSGEIPTEEKLTLEEYGEWLAKVGIMADVGNLMDQYNKRAIEAAAASDTKKNKATKEMAPDAAKSDMTVATDPWPPVGQRDWAGFTNWVQSCKATDKKFRKTLYIWHQEREKRLKNINEKLKSWTTPTGYDDGSAGYGQPTKFYRGPSIGKGDLEKAGFKLDGAGKK